MGSHVHLFFFCHPLRPVHFSWLCLYFNQYDARQKGLVCYPTVRDICVEMDGALKVRAD